MKVIATQRGYFGKLQEPGDTFDVPDGSKATWFEPVEKPKAKPDAGEKIKADIAKLEATLAKAAEPAKPDIQAKIDAKKKELDALSDDDLV